MNTTNVRGGVLVLVGFLAGVLWCALLALVTLARFVSSDLEGFRRWLDRGLA